MPQDR